MKLTQRISSVVLALVVLTSAGCGFHLQSSYFIPASLTTLHLSSSDNYSELTRLVRERLRLNNITLVNAAADIPTLRLVHDSLERSTLSLYPSGNVAEYELIYQVHFSVRFDKQEAKEFDVVIRRDYLDDPRTALAKSKEMELLLKEMRAQAADKIIQALSTVETN
ncbi:MAG: LPS assembly lipoprotein LptE [Shewanella sp.]